MKHRVAAPVGVVLAAGLLWPAAAQAHGIVQRANLPTPAVAVRLGRRARARRLVHRARRALAQPAAGGRDRLASAACGGALLGSRPVEIVCGAIGVGLLLVVVLAGFLGPQSALENFATVFVLITFWVGLVFASVLFGDVFRAFNPWRAIGRAAGWVLARRGAPRGIARTRRPWAAGRRPPRCSSSRGSSWCRAGARHPRTLAWAVHRLHGAHARRAGGLRRGDVDEPRRGVLGLLQPVLAAVDLRDARSRGRACARR